jgi:hypothetical protein
MTEIPRMTGMPAPQEDRKRRRRGRRWPALLVAGATTLALLAYSHHRMGRPEAAVDSVQIGATLTLADGTRAPASFRFGRESSTDVFGRHHSWRLTGYRIAVGNGSPEAAPFAAAAVRAPD